ncbi:MAG: hypothetical protein WEB33_13645 [Bacteroidota bacterium]
MIDIRSCRVLAACSIPILAVASCAQPVSEEGGSGPNSPPEISSLTVDPSIVIIGRWVTMRVEAEDPDGDRLAFGWSASAGDIIGEGAEVRYTASYCCVGFNTVRVRVEDGRGGVATRAVDIPVLQ